MVTVGTPTYLRPGIKKVIHMVGSQIRRKKKGENVPCVTVKCADGTFWCGSFAVEGPLLSREGFDKPTGSGAVIWLETQAGMTLYPAR